MGEDLLSRLCQVPVPSAAVISPDGRRIAYVLTTVDVDEYQRAVWIIDVDGGPPRLVTEGTAPQWSPDGRQLAIVKSGQLWLVDVGGGSSRQLTDRELGAGQAAWSPDGSRIAFSAATDLLRADGTTYPAHAPVVTRRLGYRSDGEGIRGYRRPHLFVLTLASGRLEQLTEGDWYAHSPAWSPDGSRLAFAGIQDPRTDNSLSTAPFVIEYAEGANKSAQRVGREDMVRTLTWSPDGESLIITRLAPRSETQPRLLRVPLDGSDAVDLLADVEHGAHLVPPVVTAGGRVLCAVNDRSVNRLYFADPLQELGDRDLISINALSTSATRAAVVFAGPDTYGEVALVDLSTGQRKTLTSYTKDALAELELVQPEARSFTIGDGTTVDGWLLRSSKATTPGPLLLDIHGGPHGWWAPIMNFSHPYQLALAAAGWTVLLLNPRGSDGFGDGFHAAVYGAQGFGDEKDFLEPVDELVAEGLADPSRLAVAGYSYGGYMTFWLTSRTDRFSAAVGGGGMCDLTSLTGTADVGVGMMELIYGGTDPAVLRPQSPLEYVANVETPTLILHAVNDDRSPVGQAEQWFAALHDRTIDTELVLYPEANHLFLWSGRPSHRLDYSRRTLNWLIDRIPS